MLEDFYITHNIDISKLERDYISHPLKKIKRSVGGIEIENPTKKDLQYLYIDKTLSKDIICSYYQFGKTKLTKLLNKYGIKRDKKISTQKRKETNLKKYGVSHNSQLPNRKEKLKENNLKKYGVENYFQSNEFKEKKKKSLMERYGVINNSQISSVQDAIKENNLKKYGVYNFSQSDGFRLRTNSPNIKPVKKEVWDMLGNPTSLKNFITDNDIKSTKELSDRLGIDCSCLGKYLHKANIKFQSGYNRSQPEIEISEFVKQHYDIKTNVKMLDGKEIDIFIPSLGVGIEFNGNYWHSEYEKEKYYHQFKTILAEQQDIFLYHIFEYEWVNKREQILNQLSNILQINKEKVYARNCIIKEVPPQDKQVFLAQHHLQGDDVSSVRLGLYYEDELVSIMTFVKPRFNKKYQWELSRFCSKSNCNVVGGASKLFKYFIREYKPTSIISYSNIAHTRGNLYKTLGFTLEQISEPNYIWFNHNHILTRYQCQKHKLLEKGYTGKSETDIMHSLGYYRIFDCGNKVWVLKT